MRVPRNLRLDPGTFPSPLSGDNDLYVSSAAPGICVVTSCRCIGRVWGGGGGARISREGCEAEMNLAGYSCSKFWGCLAESSMAEHGEAWRRLL